MLNNIDIANAMTIKLDNELPEMPEFVPGIRRAPNRGFRLSPEQTKIALRNACAMYLRSSTKNWLQSF